MRSNTSKRLAFIGLCLWLSGCFEGAPLTTGDASASVDQRLHMDADVRADGGGNGRGRDKDKDKDKPGVVEGDAGLEDGGACSELDAGAVALEGRAISLWPPNHKFHEISVEDCVVVRNGCGVQAEFVWASSDEPVDDNGDGHHSPDIAIAEDCRRVSVRSERQGPKDGRVYKLGVRAVDAEGNLSEATCTIVVDHDQRGVAAADSGEKYRVMFDGSAGGPACDGEPDQPPAPPGNPPPANPPPVDPPADEPDAPDAAVPDAAGPA